MVQSRQPEMVAFATFCRMYIVEESQEEMTTSFGSRWGWGGGLRRIVALYRFQ